MFNRRRSITVSLKYTRDFFKSFLTDLRSAGFKQIQVKLPLNLTSEEEYLISPEELLSRERNYPSLILQAINNEKKETIKVLFVNRNSKTVFVDDTFPSGESISPSIYIQSPDPARAYSLLEFFYEYLTKPKVARYRILWFLSIISLIIIVAQIISLFNQAEGILSYKFKLNPLWDIILSIFALVLIFQFFAEPKGLWVKENREINLSKLFIMAIRGDFKDNPLVSMIATIIGTIIAVIILKLIGITH